ncbi:MAG: alpha-ketoglutarate-dependent dioxygenase AlkB [Hyphomicrobiales bacterium]|nr:alpha-ketoglutarate-dependent dioxygenase AlkB [Hyphomicrobiales bacterium]
MSGDLAGAVGGAKPLTLQEGCVWYPGWLDSRAQQDLLDDVRAIVRAAPLFRPVMPRTGAPFSVMMTNCGPLGWVSDQRDGYRYQPLHPETGQPWPPMPRALLQAWAALVPGAPPPEACLVNFYRTDARMGLHQDRDEGDFSVPVLSLSLGDTAVFRMGGSERRGKTRAIKLASGDALVFGGAARLAFHGIDRVLPGSSTLLKEGGRINLTLRRVSAP